MDEDDNIMCGCGRFMWETQAVALQSDSPVGMTKHRFNALNSNAVEGKASVRQEKSRFHCAQLRRSAERIDQPRIAAEQRL